MHTFILTRYSTGHPCDLIMMSAATRQSCQQKVVLPPLRPIPFHLHQVPRLLPRAPLTGGHLLPSISCLHQPTRTSSSNESQVRCGVLSFPPTESFNLCSSASELQSNNGLDHSSQAASKQHKHLHNLFAKDERDAVTGLGTSASDACHENEGNISHLYPRKPYPLQRFVSKYVKLFVILNLSVCLLVCLFINVHEWF